MSAARHVHSILVTDLIVIIAFDEHIYKRLHLSVVAYGDLKLMLVLLAIAGMLFIIQLVRYFV